FRSSDSLSRFPTGFLIFAVTLPQGRQVGSRVKTSALQGITCVFGPSILRFSSGRPLCVEYYAPPVPLLLTATSIMPAGSRKIADDFLHSWEAFDRTFAAQPASHSSGEESISLDLHPPRSRPM